MRTLLEVERICFSMQSSRFRFSFASTTVVAGILGLRFSDWNMLIRLDEPRGEGKAPMLRLCSIPISLTIIMTFNLKNITCENKARLLKRCSPPLSLII